jgi:oligopeptide transport system substrate-binding protein
MRPIRLLACVLALGSACTFPRVGQPSQTTPRPQTRGTIAVALREPDSIDPSKASNRPALLVLKQICDPLVAADPLTGALKPGVAESWQVADDGKKVTFKLRKGVKFHNGREVTATDFLYSMSRFAHKETGNRLAYLLDKVAGYVEVHEGRAAALSGIKAPDPQTLEVELAEPFAELPAVLAHPAAGSAIPQEEVEKGAEAFAASPVCTGPYSISAPWQKGQDLRVKRFEGYAANSVVHSRGGAGYADEIVFKPVADSIQGYELLEAGEVQISEVPVERLTQARRVEGRVESQANGTVAYLGIPVAKSPFENRDLRRALALAIDRQRIVRDVLAGSRLEALGFLPPTAGPVSKDTRCDEMKPQGDLDQAGQALKTSGIDPGPLNLKLYYNDGGSGHDAWMKVVSEQWQKNLGIGSTLQSDEWGKYLDFLVQGADGPFRLAWAVEYPSPESFFGPIFSTGSLDNYTRFSNAEFDDLLKKARATAPDQARRNLYAQAAQVLCREVPVVPMWFSTNHFAFHPSITAAATGRLDFFGDPILREIGRKS